MNIPNLSELLPKIDVGKSVQVPDAWVTWPGKDAGAPRPPIIWLDRKPSEERK